MKKQTDCTLLALAIPFCLAVLFNLPACYNQSAKPAKPKRVLLEMGYNTKTKNLKNDLQRIESYTIDAIYLEGKDTVRVQGITQEQYDSLNISE